MGDRRIQPTDRERSAPGAAPHSRESRPAAPGAAAPGPSTPAPAPTVAAPPRRAGAKFGAATDGWDAYNSWLDRVRQPPPPSRQAVIAKSLYSVSSYKSWADKARGAFDPGGVPGGIAPATGTGKAK